MAYEDFTTYDETDENNEVTIIASKVSWVDVNYLDTVHVSKSKGVNHFNGDFEHLFECYYTKDGWPYCVINWGLGNYQEDRAQVVANNHDGIYLKLGHASDEKRCSLELYTNGSPSYDYSVPISFSTIYYITLSRDDDGGANNTGQYIAEIRTGSHTGTLVDTLTLDCAAGEQNDYEYIFACSGYDIGGSQPTFHEHTGYTQNLDLQEIPPLELIGFIAGTAGTDGVLDSQPGCVGFAAGISGTSGDLSFFVVELSGSIVGVFDVDGSLDSQPELIGSTAGTFGADGSLDTQSGLIGSTVGIFGVDGSLKFDTINLIGLAVGISGADGSLDTQSGLIGSTVGIFGVDGSLKFDTINLIGLAVGISGADGSLDVAIELIGFVTEVLETGGELVIVWLSILKTIIGSTNGQSNLFGWLIPYFDGRRNCIANTIIIGSLSTAIQLQGSVAGISGIAGKFEPVLIGFYESLTNQITSYFNAFADVNDLAVRYDNDPRPTPSSGLWCECGVDLGSTEQSELGVDSFRNVSNFNIRIKNSIGLGTNELLEKADIVATIFRRKNLNRIIFKVPRIVKVGRIEDNYQVNVICPFFVDKIGR